MSVFIKLYHFLGSIYFAIILIAAVAAFVVAGTFIESITQSHRYAAKLIYSNPFFGVLLWGFFVNILFSALRRWPFRVKHLPFLITHTGLLMILGGALVKTYAGLQGTMQIMEGASSNQISEADTYVVQVEKEDGSKESYALNELTRKHTEKKTRLDLNLLYYAPNSTERLTTWIKGDKAIIQGLQPLPVHEVGDLLAFDEIPLSGKARFHGPDSPAWHIYAFRTSDSAKAVEKLFLQEALLRISDRNSGITLATTPIRTLLEKGVQMRDALGVYGEVTGQLFLNFSAIAGFADPRIELTVTDRRNSGKYHIRLPLNGDNAILNQNTGAYYLGHAPVAIDIIRPPMLAALEDEYGDTHLVGCDAYGYVWTESYGGHSLHSYLSYEEGFGGYAVQQEFPYPKFACGREQREAALKEYLAIRLRQAESTKITLSPPLQLLQTACHQVQVDFVDTLLSFLDRWNKTYSWLYDDKSPLPESFEQVLQNLNWNNHPYQACEWTAQLFDHLEPAIKQEDNLLEILRAKHWPLISACENVFANIDRGTADETNTLLTLLMQQVFSAADHLPLEKDLSAAPGSSQQARLLSAYMRAYGIHLSQLAPAIDEAEMRKLISQHQGSNFNPISAVSTPTLETPLVAHFDAAPKKRKLEDNIPMITLRAKEGDHVQTISLSYDQFAAGLKWPILNGHYLLRFQPNFVDIPYRIRLRNARQINYANSQQAFSYESNIVVTDIRSGRSVETTISMNQVHETWDGYRFYLANISPNDESAAKHVQIVVNHDPAKYWLTYPGAFILSCGIVFLFWMKPYSKKTIRRRGEP